MQPTNKPPRHKRNRQTATNPRQVLATLGGMDSQLPPPEILGDPMLDASQTDSPPPTTFGSETFSGRDKAPDDRKRRKPAKEKPVKLSYREKLEKLYGSIGVWLSIANEKDGMIVLSQASDMASSVFDVAEDLKSKGHAEMYDVLVKIVDGNVWFNFVGIHAGLILALLVNHEMLPSGVLRVFGVRKAMPEADQQAAMLQQQQARQDWHTVAPEDAAMLQAYADAMAAQHMQGAQADYDPTDSTPRWDHNPALLGGLVERR